MGIVFLIHDSSNDPSSSSPFALKLLNKSSAPSKIEGDSQPKKHQKNLTRQCILATGDAKLLKLNKAKSARVSLVSGRRPIFSGSERSNSFVGTEECVVPKIVHGDGHEFAVNWWALGVLA